jgi:hypothetical protein
MVSGLGYIHSNNFLRVISIKKQLALQLFGELPKAGFIFKKRCLLQESIFYPQGTAPIHLISLRIAVFRRFFFDYPAFFAEQVLPALIARKRSFPRIIPVVSASCKYFGAKCLSHFSTGVSHGMNLASNRKGTKPEQNSKRYSRTHRKKSRILIFI